MHPPGFVGGGCGGGGLLGRKASPDTSQRHLGIGGRHPVAGETADLLDQMEFIRHGSSSVSPRSNARFLDAQRRDDMAAECWTAVREGESGFDSSGSHAQFTGQVQ